MGKNEEENGDDVANEGEIKEKEGRNIPKMITINRKRRKKTRGMKE